MNVAFPPGTGPQEVFGRRIAAFALDSLIIGAATSVIVTPIVIASMPAPTGAPPSIAEMTKLLTSQLPIQAAIWVLTLTYFFVCEAYWHGQTVGKRAMRLRVIMADGSPVTRGAVLQRTLMRIVDEMLCTVLVGLVAAMTSGERQRLGDRVARTLVVDAAAADQALGGWGSGPWPGGSEPPVTGPGPAPDPEGWHGLPGESNPWGSR